MGAGVARLCLDARLSVTLTDLSQNALDVADTRLRQVTSTGHLTCGDFTSAVEDAQIVIDATPQLIDAKREVIQSVAAASPPDSVIGTITLVVPLAKLDPDETLSDRLLGFHFMNPPHKLRFCELVTRDQVNAAAVARSAEFLHSIGVKTIRTADEPGFVLNALLVPFLIHAARVFEQGSANADDIDLAFTAGCGHPMGPLAIMDLLGLDVVVRTAEVLHAELGPDSACKPPRLLRELAASGGAFHPRASR